MEGLSEAAERIQEQGSVKILSHLDADGISAAAIMSTALDRIGVENRVEIVKQLKAGIGKEFTILTDLGSGQLDLLKGRECVIIDHHQPMEGNWKGLTHLNAYLLGWNGSNEISGAGMAYLVANELGGNTDLSPLAIVGAVGDVQNAWGKMEGMNCRILEDGKRAGLISVQNDLAAFGRETRPIFKALQYFTDPYIPGVSNCESGSAALLKQLGIPVKKGSEWRTLSELDKGEKKKLCTELVKRALHHSPPALKRHVGRLIIGEVYEFLKEKKRTELRNATEFSTCLNACGRNGRPEIGLELCKGGRASAYEKMQGLLKTHRRNLAKGMEFVEGTGVKKRENLQWFDARGEIKETIVGTIAGMLLGSEYADPYLPIIGVSESDNGDLKLSGRCSRLLVMNGINLGKAMRKAAEKTGGRGGGHGPAAGAYVPEANLEKFLASLDSII